MTYKQAKELNKELVIPTYEPSDNDREISQYVSRRVEEMKNYRLSLGVEQDWKEADAEYVPTELEFGAPRKHLEQDQSTGLRSRMVQVGTDADNWRSSNAAPTLMNKVLTAMSIIIERNPEAVLTSLSKKYESTSTLANALWKRSWEINNSKEVLRLFAMNLAKYGWAVGRSYPRLVKYTKSVMTEYDSEKPENNKYDEKELVWFNDLARQNLDPWKTWIDEQTVPYDRFSMNDCYYELDFSYDAAKVEFGKYANFKYVVPGSVKKDENQKQEDGDDKRRRDLVTIGFYENRLRDLFVIIVPSQKLVLHSCPLPNDDGLLSVWHCPWVLRDTKHPYGIGIWRMIRQNKQLYDKMLNMTMDQLVLSIMKMFFYTGTAGLLGDGNIKIRPGVGKQITNGDIKWLDVPGPGDDSYKGLQLLQSMMDDDSGITPTLEGEVTGRTLGEILHAKEAALKKLRIPLDNIADAIEQDAYISLSWMAQIYSTPEVKEFSDLNDMSDYETETGTQHNELFQDMGEDGMMQGLQATYLPELALHLEKGEDNSLVESPESRFFQVGKDIEPGMLRWQGIIKVIPKSVLSPSLELEKQRKMELFNVLAPLLIQPPELYAKALKQIVKINEEDPEDWLPDSWLQDQQEQPLFVDTIQQQAQGGVGGAPLGGETLQGQQGMGQQASPTVVPRGQISGPAPAQLSGGMKPPSMSGMGQ